MKFKKYQLGGEVPAQEPAAPQGNQGGGAEEQLMQMAVEIIQSLGPEGAMLLAEAIAQLVQQASQPQEAPVYAKKGGKLVKIN